LLHLPVLLYSSDILSLRAPRDLSVITIIFGAPSNSAFLLKPFHSKYQVIVQDVLGVRFSELQMDLNHDSNEP
jgi:hypothetical protein